MIKNIILDIGGVIVEDSSKKYKDEKYREKLNMSYDEIREYISNYYNDVLKSLDPEEFYNMDITDLQ